jgi:hypothetical protein
MKFSYKELPGGDRDYLRPVAAVRVESLSVRVGCLLDTGSIMNRFGVWVAEAAGLDLDGAEVSEAAVAGVATRSRVVPVDLSIDGMNWRAPVAFCDPWPFGFQLLGQEGFFRFFRASFQASIYEFALTADAGEHIPSNG